MAATTFSIKTLSINDLFATLSITTLCTGCHYPKCLGGIQRDFKFAFWQEITLNSNC